MVIAKPFLSFGWRLGGKKGRLGVCLSQSLYFFPSSGPLWQDPHLWFLYLCQPTCLQRDRAVSRSEVFFKKLSKAKIAIFFPVRTQIVADLSLFFHLQSSIAPFLQMWSERAQLGVA